MEYRWVDQDKSKVIRKSPLLLFPVKLERSSAASRFRLRFHEDEPRFNQTLVQFVKQKFDLQLPEFREGLPSEGRDVDVKRVLDHVRQAVRDVPGFEVLEETALSTFSFAKYLMWKDLTDRTDALRQNRVVKHLIDNPDQMLPGADAPFPNERNIDLIAPADLILPLSANSSQIAACVAAAQGRDFTVIGPPGTGKSQTIANLIAMLLGIGQRVLFVAEKTAALDVVYRRLDEKNLADHCLELHSNKADRRHFLSQLKKSWETGSAANQGDWVAINDRLQIRRDQLNLYVEALHTPQTNGWSAFRAISVAAPQMKDSGQPASKQDRVVAMLQQKNGSSIQAITTATGWQQHSVRGFFAGVVRKKLRLNLISEEVGGKRIYRIAPGKPGARKRSRRCNPTQRSRRRSTPATRKRYEYRLSAAADNFLNGIQNGLNSSTNQPQVIDLYE